MGFLAVGCLLGCAALLVHTQSCRVPTVPPRCGITAFHLSSRQQDKLFGLGFWVLGFFFFPVACGLLGFMHSKKARGGGVCVNMMKPICMLLSKCNVVDGTRPNSRGSFVCCSVAAVL